MRAMSCASSLNVFGTSRSRPNACSTLLRVSLNRSASSRYLARSAGNPRSMPSALPLQSAIWLERSLIRPLRPSIALPSSSSRLPSLRAFQSVLTPSERLGVAASISSTSCRRHSSLLQAKGAPCGALRSHWAAARHGASRSLPDPAAAPGRTLTRLLEPYAPASRFGYGCGGAVCWQLDHRRAQVLAHLRP